MQVIINWLNFQCVHVPHIFTANIQNQFTRVRASERKACLTRAKICFAEHIMQYIKMALTALTPVASVYTLVNLLSAETGTGGWGGPPTSHSENAMHKDEMPDKCQRICPRSTQTTRKPLNTAGINRSDEFPPQKPETRLSAHPSNRRAPAGGGG